jgi:hypothetical protein
MIHCRVSDANQVVKKRRRSTPGVTIKTINQRVYPWFDDIERHVEGLGYKAGTLAKVKKFARQYRKDQEPASINDFEPPCTSCRDRVIWFCSVTGFECKQFKTYCGQQLKKGK